MFTYFTLDGHTNVYIVSVKRTYVPVSRVDSAASCESPGPSLRPSWHALLRNTPVTEDTTLSTTQASTFLACY